MVRNIYLFICSYLFLYLFIYFQFKVSSSGAAFLSLFVSAAEFGMLPSSIYPHCPLVWETAPQSCRESIDLCPFILKSVFFLYVLF
ncbi:hypothetical protein XENTR_v10002287 [Xenopus tropicalis]|nr:hypothetical protein XENTR_v10002287 [Xenopus tropicalis]